MSDKKFEILKKLIEDISSQYLLSEKKKKGRCWDGYEPVPGKEPYSKGSCQKAEESVQSESDVFEDLLETIDDAAFEQMLSEAAKRSMSRVRDHVQGRSVGFITANRATKPNPKNPTGKPLDVSKAENRSNNKALEKDIKDAGYGFVRVKGGWVEKQEDGSEIAKREPSYLVVGPKHDDKGKLKEFLKHHGSKYNQDAVLYKHHDNDAVLDISTSDRRKDNPRHSESPIGKFHPGRFGSYFTALHGDADTDKNPKEMTPDERRAHKQASLKKKTFVFESMQFEFSEDEDVPVAPGDLTYYARLSEHTRKNKTQ